MTSVLGCLVLLLKENNIDFVRSKSSTHLYRFLTMAEKMRGTEGSE
jgi:hypothetical protein